ncbi:MAG: OstA-like protein [Candidatus Gastranaerophilaceae bacterium]
MKVFKKLLLNISILLAAISLPCFAADLTIDTIRNQAFDNPVYKQPAYKEVSLFSKKDKKEKNNKKGVSVQHFDNSEDNGENSLTDTTYIKKYKEPLKKNIRKKQFSITVQTNDIPEELDEEKNNIIQEADTKEDESAKTFEPSDKKFFSKIKKKKLKSKKNDNQVVYKPSNIILIADTTNYYPEQGEIEAIGNAKLEITGQDFILYGDKLIINHDTNSVRAYDNVKIIQKENTTTGDFINIDMSTASGWIQKPVSSNYSVKIHANEAYVYPDKIEEYDGVANIMEDKRILVGGASYSNIFNFQGATVGDSYLYQREPKPVKFKVKDIKVTSKEGHNVINMKGVGVYYRKFKLGAMPSLQLVTDKEQTVMQMNGPEFGNTSELGMFIGPSIVLNTPLSSTLKISPLLVYSDDESKLGVGAAATFMSGSNFTQAAYGSAENKFLLKGFQSITPNLKLNYSQNSYVSQWFLGYRRPMYSIDLEYSDNYYIKDLNAKFEQRLSGGAYSDFGRISKMAEGRLRWMTQLSRNFLSYTNSANTFAMDVGLVGQTSLSQYTTGDTLGIVRIGPSLNTTYRGWSQNFIYFQSGVAGNTPFIFDDYYYSKSNLQIIETLRLNKFISLGYVASLALGGIDSYYTGASNPATRDFFQENMFMVNLGPDDAKVTLLYDAYRKTTAIYFSMLLGTKDMDIAFDKTTIHNPDTLMNENKQLHWIKDKFNNIRYKVFPLTNPNFDRTKDLYPSENINTYLDEEDSNSGVNSDSDDPIIKEFGQTLSPFIQNQELMKRGL